MKAHQLIHRLGDCVRRIRPYLWLISLLVVAWLGWSWYLDGIYARTRIRLREIRAYAKQLAPLLSADADFAKVQVTGKGDSVTIHGYIADQASFARLRSVVVGRPPPVKVVFHLNSENTKDVFYEVIPLTGP
jgi:hypothetical protein